jgi:hypothetical protein
MLSDGTEAFDNRLREAGMISIITSRQAVPLAAFGLLTGAAMLLVSRRAAKPSLSNVSATHAARQINAGAATLAFSVLADSSLEHFRGGLYNPAMFVAPTVSAATLAAAVTSARQPAMVSRSRQLIFGSAALTGLAGFGFHIYNISRQIGGWSWGNVFYKAPVGAPMAIHLAGLLGLTASHVANEHEGTDRRLFGIPTGRVLGLGVAGALFGTAAEAALLHFRGAFHSRYMYLPVTVPPAAALSLSIAVICEAPLAVRVARAMLRTTVLLGFIGVGFHARGVARNMGGWRNWSQNIQAGPPLPAPPSFTGLALVGLAALNLLPKRSRP